MNKNELSEDELIVLDMFMERPKWAFDTQLMEEKTSLPKEDIAKIFRSLSNKGYIEKGTGYDQYRLKPPEKMFSESVIADIKKLQAVKSKIGKILGYKDMIKRVHNLLEDSHRELSDFMLIDFKKIERELSRVSMTRLDTVPIRNDIVSFAESIEIWAQKQYPDDGFLTFDTNMIMDRIFAYMKALDGNVSGLKDQSLTTTDLVLGIGTLIVAMWTKTRSTDLRVSHIGKGKVVHIIPLSYAIDGTTLCGVKGELTNPKLYDEKKITCKVCLKLLKRKGSNIIVNSER